eukprot:3551054-Amphidinium_carterae.1
MKAISRTLRMQGDHPVMSKLRARLPGFMELLRTASASEDVFSPCALKHPPCNLPAFAMLRSYSVRKACRDIVVRRGRLAYSLVFSTLSPLNH